jgi:O-antigen ligase
MLYKREGLAFGLPKSFILLLIFFFWAMITMILNTETFQWSYCKTFFKVWNFLPYLLIPILSKKIQDQTHSILNTLIGTSVGVVLLGSFQYVLGFPYFFEGWFGVDALVEKSRFRGFQSHPLHAGALYTLAFSLSFTKTLFSFDQPSKGRTKIFWVGLSLILASGVLLTGSRSYYLGMLAAFFMLLGFKGRKWFLTALSVSGIFLLTFATFVPYPQQRLKTLQTSKISTMDLNRVYMWKVARKMLQDHPLIGIGYKNWKYRLPHYFHYFPEWKEIDSGVYGHAHNTYLTVAAETGGIGILLFLSFWVCLFYEEWQFLHTVPSRSFAHYLASNNMASILALMTAALFEHNLLTATVNLTLCFLLGLRRAWSGHPV